MVNLLFIVVGISSVLAFVAGSIIATGITYWFYSSRNKKNTNQEQLQSLQNLLQVERIINYFATSMANKHTADEVLWDVCNNLVSQLGFVDCMLYLWNEDKTKMVQKAGYGPKGSIEEIKNMPFDVLPGQGVVGAVIQSKEIILIGDTSKDSRYRADEMVRLSEICVPIMLHNELIGIIDSEHPQLNYYNETHVTILKTLASMIANKLDSIDKQQILEQQRLSLYLVKQQKADAELSTLRSQMNPHFIFNTLNSINSYVIKNEPKQASIYLTKFAQLMRTILDNSQNKLISLNKELETLELYVFMERLRFSNAFEFNIDMCMEINAEDVEVPPLILQPFIENAIWHGLLHKEGQGKITICLDIVEKDWLLVQIEDNGIGREKSAALKSNSIYKTKSYGLAITAKRLSLLAAEDEQHKFVEIQDIVDEQGVAQGTKVVLKIPV